MRKSLKKSENAYEKYISIFYVFDFFLYPSLITTNKNVHTSNRVGVNKLFRMRAKFYKYLKKT